MTAIIVLKVWNDTQLELWKPIKGFLGYEVSNKGQVRSYWQSAGPASAKLGTSPHILKVQTNRTGYCYVMLYVKGRRQNCQIHQLVARAFIYNDRPNEAKITNHRNNVSTDNRAENLEWSTILENNRHAASIGVSPAGERNGMSKLNQNAVAAIRFRFNNKERAIDLAAEYDISSNYVYALVNGRRWGEIT